MYRAGFRLEYKLKRKLQDTRIRRGCTFGETTCGQRINRIPTIDIVKYIEEFRTELESSALGDMCILQQTKIGVKRPRPF